jgi:hypothetical protein
MTEHPAVTFLLAAHTKAEALAQAANRPDAQMHPENPVEFILSSVDLSTRAIRAGERFIEANMPDAALLRVAAERDLLVEHQPQRYASLPIHESCADLNCDCYEEVATCGTCAPGHYYDGDPQPWPCATVQLIARGWGWTE